MRIGIDIIETTRMKKLIGTDRIARIFTVSECEYLKTKNWAPQSVAGIFCAKEAYFKALGTGIHHGKLLDIEIIHDDMGAPSYNIKNATLKHNATLSISHTRTTAVAVCIIF
ncbi:MAG: holo-ACP synthase [Firmicutes bacterium]|nr:holo-ACP synthase [Bacillota bacterium]